MRQQRAVVPFKVTALARSLRLVSVWFVLVMLSTATRRAEARQWSPYEQETVLIALDKTGDTLEPNPDGKILEGVDVFTLDVFEPRDAAPLWLNWFHTTTRHYVTKREVLLKVGQRYDSRTAIETERNLRNFPQLSVVLVVPVKGSAEDRVKLLIITKDVWSLRASTQPTIYNGKLSALTVAPSETNIFGTTQSVSAVLGFNPNTYSIGGHYYIPRIGGSRVSAQVSGSGIFNCATNNLEGASGLFIYGQPLYSSLAKWAWQTAASWNSVMSRPSSANSICSGGNSSPTIYAATPNVITGPPGAQTLTRREVLFPNETRIERLRGQFILTRSFNRWYKINISTGMELDWRAYSRQPVKIEDTPNEEVVYTQRPDGSFGNRTVIGGSAESNPDSFKVGSSANLTPSVVADPGDRSLNPVEFAAFHRHYLSPDRLPPRDRRISPYIQLRAFSNTFRRVVNYNTLGLQEDVQVGHELYLRLYPSFRPLSTRDALGMFASAMYTVPFSKGGLWRSLVSTTIVAGKKTDAEVRFATHMVTPDIGVGRFVYDAGLVDRPMQYLNGNYIVGGGGVSQFANGYPGGTGRLRGFKPVAASGPGTITFNHEFRSRPLRLFSVLWGLVLFHDMGTAVQAGFTGLHFRQGAGVGLRVLAPQVDRTVFRIDFGFPLVFPMQDDPQAQFTFLAAFGQAVGTPVSFPNALLVQ